MLHERRNFRYTYGTYMAKIAPEAPKLVLLYEPFRVVADVFCAPALRASRFAVHVHGDRIRNELSRWRTLPTNKDENHIG